MIRLPFTLLHAALVPALAIGLAAPAFAQSVKSDPPSASAKSATQATQNYRAMRASKLIDKSVRGTDGKNIGQIRDLVVNMNTGDVRYAMLEFDPGIFKAEQLFAVPTKELRLAADGDDLSYNMSKERLERASVNKSEWKAALKDRRYIDQVDKAYGVTQPSRDARAFRASELIGKDVMSRDGKDIGDIKDLVINMAAGKVHYAALAFDPSLASPEELYAFPLKAFNLTADKDELVLDVDKSKIQAMKKFDAQRWANLNDRVWVADVDHYLITVSGTATDSPAAVFARLDDDKNGFLSETEAKDNTGVHSAWKQLDKNSDGKVSRSEFTGNYKMER